MRDIEKAMNAEAYYLKVGRSEGESLIELVKPFGYSNLDDYFKDKAEYKLKAQDYAVLYVDVDDIFAKVEAAITQEAPSIFVIKASRTIVWHGKDEELNRELCKELGYEVIPLDYNGGNIVTGVGDFNFIFVCKKVDGIGTQWFMEKFAAYFSRFFGDVVCNENDILINGKKVMGSMQRETETMYEFATQISFVDRSEDIYKICPPTGAKKPSAIPSGFFTCDDLWNEVLSWLHLK